MFTGGVDIHGQKIQETVEFDAELSKTFILSGNPRPIFSISLPDKEENYQVPGKLLNFAKRKYRFDLKFPLKPSYCGQNIKYWFAGYKDREYNLVGLYKN